MEKNIEIYEAEQALQKRNRALTIGVDRGMLRIQFPSKVSSCFWGQKQGCVAKIC